MTTTTLRIEDILKSRAAEAAQRAGKTPHAFMLDAITEPVDQLELNNAFHRVADALGQIDDHRKIDKLGSGQALHGIQSTRRTARKPTTRKLAR